MQGYPRLSEAIQGYPTLSIIQDYLNAFLLNTSAINIPVRSGRGVTSMTELCMVWYNKTENNFSFMTASKQKNVTSINTKNFRCYTTVSWCFKYRTRAKISNAMLIQNSRGFWTRLFSSIFKIYLIFWPISMHSRHVYGSNILLKYTVMLW